MASAVGKKHAKLRHDELDVENIDAIIQALTEHSQSQPRWSMFPVHMSPEEAVAAHRIPGAATSIAVHHSTFQLANEALDALRPRLRTCASDP